MKRLLLCVDDFGLKPSINEAVAELVDAGLVTVTACMSQGPAWPEGAALLRGARRKRVDVGLHLNLTEPLPGAASGPGPLVMPLPQLILKALMRALDTRLLAATVSAQLDAFEAVWGAAPDFVDGHQHVHQLPQVREVLLAELQRRYRDRPADRRPWLRFTRARRTASSVGFKPRVIECLGAHEFARQARLAGFRLNGALLGVYGFDADAQGYGRHLQGWLDAAHEGDELMMHPARPGAAGGPVCDPIERAREVEYTVLREQGAQLLRSAGACGVRMGDLSSILMG